jgi:hypothetical protein
MTCSFGIAPLVFIELDLDQVVVGGVATGLAGDESESQEEKANCNESLHFQNSFYFLFTNKNQELLSTKI